MLLMISPAKEARKSPSKLRRKFATNFAENFANFTLEIAGAYKMAIFPVSRGKNRISQGVENRGSLLVCLRPSRNLSCACVQDTWHWATKSGAAVDAAAATSGAGLGRCLAFTTTTRKSCYESELGALACSTPSPSPGCCKRRSAKGWPGPSTETCQGFLLYKFWRILPGILLEDFSGHFSHKNEKKSRDKIRKKSGGSKIKIREKKKSFLPKADPKGGVR